MTEKRYERVFEDRNDLAIFDKQEQYRDKESLYLSGDGVVDLLNEQEEKICALNTLINQSLPVWVIEKVINRRIQTTTDENVQKELKNLLEELI